MQCFRYKYCLEKPTFTRNKTDKLKQATQKYRSKLTNSILKANYTLPRLYFLGDSPLIYEVTMLVKVMGYDLPVTKFEFEFFGSVSLVEC